jgi:aspartate-semialdehyde dehydrogenase
VPVLYAHSQAVHIETTDAIDAEQARRLLMGAPGVVLVDEPAQAQYPLPREAAGRDEVFVGRIRRDASHPRGLALWVVSDNLRKGAATNAVQIAESLVQRGWL